MLREIVRQGGAVSAEQLDGRVAQALARRGLLRSTVTLSCSPTLGGTTSGLRMNLRFA
jgi:hypothetical protein